MIFYQNVDKHFISLLIPKKKMFSPEYEVL